MPRLVKGGKHVYGWSLVSDVGVIRISREALVEYGYKPGVRLILMHGSRRSRGFSASTLEKLRATPFIDQLEPSPIFRYESPEGETMDINGKPFCWVMLDAEDRIRVPLKTLGEYGVKPGDRLLATRGSRLGIGFPVTGPLIEEAKRHPGLECLTA